MESKEDLIYGLKTDAEVCRISYKNAINSLQNINTFEEFYSRLNIMAQEKASYNYIEGELMSLGEKPFPFKKSLDYIDLRN